MSKHCQDTALQWYFSLLINKPKKKSTYLGSVGHQWRWQQQNKALNPHKEELYYEVGDANCPQNLPETQRLNGWAEEDEAGRRMTFRLSGTILFKTFHSLPGFAVK